MVVELVLVLVLLCQILVSQATASVTVANLKRVSFVKHLCDPEVPGDLNISSHCCPFMSTPEFC